MRSLAFLLIGLAAAACSDTEPFSAPVPTTRTPGAEPPAQQAPAFPVVTRPADIYVEVGALYAVYSAYHNGLISSRYVLYTDGKFSLQFFSARFGFFEYGGRYVRTAGALKFYFDGWSAVGGWEADAVETRDVFEIKYSDAMTFSDFIGGTYKRTP